MRGGVEAAGGGDGGHDGGLGFCREHDHDEVLLLPDRNAQKAAGGFAAAPAAFQHRAAASPGPAGSVNGFVAVARFDGYPQQGVRVFTHGMVLLFGSWFAATIGSGQLQNAVLHAGQRQGQGDARPAPVVRKRFIDGLKHRRDVGARQQARRQYAGGAAQADGVQQFGRGRALGAGFKTKGDAVFLQHFHHAVLILGLRDREQQPQAGRALLRCSHISIPPVPLRCRPACWGRPAPSYGGRTAGP